MARNGTVSGGRPKGRKNNSTLEADELARKLGVDPFEILLLMAKGDYKALGYQSEMQTISVNESGSVEDFTIPVAVRAKCAAQATEFLRPKLKAVDISGDGLKDALAYSFTALMAEAAKHAEEDPGTSGTS